MSSAHHRAAYLPTYLSTYLPTYVPTYLSEYFEDLVRLGSIPAILNSDTQGMTTIGLYVGR